MSALGPHEIKVLRAGSRTGDYGTAPVADWSTATEAVYAGCSVQPVVGSEYTVDRDTTSSRLQVWAPLAVDITSADRVEVAGAVYDVDGEIQRWDFPPLSHMVIPLVRSQDS